MCLASDFNAATRGDPARMARGALYAGSIMSKAMGNPNAAGALDRFKQGYRDRHGGMTAAQVGQRGQS